MDLIKVNATVTPISTNNPMKNFVGILSMSFNANKIINGMKHITAPTVLGCIRMTNKINPKPRTVKPLTGLGFSSTFFFDFEDLEYFVLSEKSNLIDSGFRLDLPEPPFDMLVGFYQAA